MKTSTIDGIIAANRVKGSERSSKRNTLPTLNWEEIFTIFTVSLNGEQQQIVADAPVHQHIPIVAPEATVIVKAISCNGDIAEVNLGNNNHLRWLEDNGLVIDLKATAQQLAEGIYQMMIDALLKESLVYEDLEQGLHRLVGVTHHTKTLDKDVKKALLKCLYKGLRGGNLSRLYRQLRASQK